MDGFEVDYKKYYKVVRDVVINARLISPGPDFDSLKIPFFYVLIINIL